MSDAKFRYYPDLCKLCHKISKENVIVKTTAGLKSFDQYNSDNYSPSISLIGGKGKDKIERIYRDNKLFTY